MSPRAAVSDPLTRTWRSCLSPPATCWNENQLPQALQSADGRIRRLTAGKLSVAYFAPLAS